MMGELRIMDGRRGDVALAWRLDDPLSVAKAEEFFKRVVAKGRMWAYAMDADGRHGQVIDTFQKEAERIVVTPRLQGG